MFASLTDDPAQTSAAAVDLDICSDRIRLSTNEAAAASYAIEVRVATA
jgi:hypothetical protein